MQAISCKIRLGLNQGEKDRHVFLRAVKAANEHLDFITVHGRHAKQRSSEPCDWRTIAQIKDLANIPVIANGDAFHIPSVESMLQTTKADGVMLARGAIANPWLFGALCRDKAPGALSPSEAEAPTPAQVSEALSVYEGFAKEHKTKHKFVEFHRSNFKRLQTLAEKNNLDGFSDAPSHRLPLPRNQHI